MQHSVMASQEASPLFVSTKGDIPTDSIDWGSKVTPINGVITFYFAKDGESFDDQTSDNWNATGKAAAVLAMKQYENVIGVKFVETTNPDDANFKFEISSDSGSDTLGYFNPPGEDDAGVGWFNSGGLGWTGAGLVQGGNGFITLLHEFGHAMGLAHPHDDGGTSTIMHGVTGEFDSYGDFGLNQGVYTTMTYNDGWPTELGETPSQFYGRQGTTMALDIAVLQAKYGANTSYKTGNDTYLLPSANKSGTFFACIWDAGGTDKLQYNGTVSTTIDLRAATLKYEVGGGGFVSSAAGIYGGFTIANGVVIENATGCKGADKITGNAAANVLNDGGAGTKADTMAGLDGNDTYLVYNSSDVIIEITGAAAGAADRVMAAVDFTLKAGVYVEILTTISGTATTDIDLTGNALKQEITGNYGDNLLSSGGVGGSGDLLRGLLGDDTYRIYNATDSIVESASQGDGDRVLASVSYVLGVGVGIEFLRTSSGSGTGAINLTGNEFGQDIIGNAGANRLEGKGGADTLSGLSGADTFVFATKLGGGNIDTILDFNPVADRFLLSDNIFIALTPGVISVAQFQANTAGLAQDASDRIIYDTNDGGLFYDADGNGATASLQFAIVGIGLAITNADFVVA